MLNYSSPMQRMQNPWTCRINNHLWERNILTVSFPAAAESPAYRTLQSEDKQKGPMSLWSTCAWNGSSSLGTFCGHPFYIISTISSVTVVVYDMCGFNRENNAAYGKVKASGLRNQHKQARLGRGQPKTICWDKTINKQTLEKQFEITYGYPVGVLKNWGRQKSTENQKKNIFEVKWKV